MSEFVPQPYVLVVEDDDEVRSCLVDVLVMEGYSARPAAEGGEALRVIEAHGPPSLILLDVNMPGMNGRELFRRVRGDARLEHIPMVVVSGTDRIAGADAQLDKPVELNALVALIDRLYLR